MPNTANTILCVDNEDALFLSKLDKMAPYQPITGANADDITCSDVQTVLSDSPIEIVAPTSAVSFHGNLAHLIVLLHQLSAYLNAQPVALSMINTAADTVVCLTFTIPDKQALADITVFDSMECTEPLARLANLYAVFLITYQQQGQRVIQQQVPPYTLTTLSELCPNRLLAPSVPNG